MRNNNRSFVSEIDIGGQERVNPGQTEANVDVHVERAVLLPEVDVPKRPHVSSK